MSNIKSGKYYQVVILGEVPPGVVENMAISWVVDAVSFSATLAATVMQTHVTLLQEKPPTVDGPPKLSLS